MNKIQEIIEKLNSLADKGEAFEFWNILNESEKEIKNLESAISGTLEKGVILEGNLLLGEGSLVKAGSRIEGNVYVGKNCTIGPNAYLRSGTIIADNCHIGISEIKNSIILSNSNVPHFSYVGDSVICRNCNLGAGTKVANLRHDNENVKVSFKGKKIDTGRRKLGALFLDNVKTGINSSINCGAILEKGARVLPNEYRV